MAISYIDEGILQLVDKQKYASAEEAYAYMLLTLTPVLQGKDNPAKLRSALGNIVAIAHKAVSDLNFALINKTFDGVMESELKLYRRQREPKIKNPIDGYGCLSMAIEGLKKVISDPSHAGILYSFVRVAAVAHRIYEDLGLEEVKPERSKKETPQE